MRNSAVLKKADNVADNDDNDNMTRTNATVNDDDDDNDEVSSKSTSTFLTTLDLTLLEVSRHICRPRLKGILTYVILTYTGTETCVVWGIYTRLGYLYQKSTFSGKG